MDEAEIRELLEKKQENPRLVRIPLNLGNRFLRGGKQQVMVENVLTECSVLLILFAADWCNISKPFIKNLLAHYEQINLQQKNMEIIYVSFDKTKRQFENMTAGTPWLSISYEDARVKGLKEFYNVRSIPLLVLVDSDGQIVSQECRQDVYSMKQDPAFEKWCELKKAAELSRNQPQQQ